MNLHAYMSFNGNCQEALDFYAHALNGKVVESHLYSENEQMCSHIPADWHSKIMHASFSVGEIFFMASDVLPDSNCPGAAASGSGSISLSLNFTSEDEQSEVFNKLSHGGNVTMALADTFWGARFGMLVDKFGIKWMFNYDKPKA